MRLKLNSTRYTSNHARNFIKPVKKLNEVVLEKNRNEKNLPFNVDVSIQREELRKGISLKRTSESEFQSPTL